jgi:hypothetical protein
MSPRALALCFTLTVASAPLRGQTDAPARCPRASQRETLSDGTRQVGRVDDVVPLKHITVFYPHPLPISRRI